MNVVDEATPAAVLTHLLNLPRYRKMWGQYVQRKRGNNINIRAVASHLAFDLSDEAGFELSPDKLKDSVRRALNGELITDRTANRFIMGFGFVPEEASQLWRAMVNQRKQEIMVDGEAPRLAKKTADYVPYRTLEQIVKVNCNRFGLTQSLEITNSFIIEENNVEYVKPVIESPDLDIEILEGGTLSRIHDQATSLYHKFSNSAHSVVIKLPYAMHKNEVHRIRMKIAVNETHATLAPEEPLNFFLNGLSR